MARVRKPRKQPKKRLKRRPKNSARSTTTNDRDAEDAATIKRRYFDIWEPYCPYYDGDGKYKDAAARMWASNILHETRTPRLMERAVDAAVADAPNFFKLWDDNIHAPNSDQYVWLKANLNLVPALTQHIVPEEARDRLVRIMFTAVYAGGEMVMNSNKRRLVIGVYNFMQSLQRYNNLTPMPRLSDTHTEYEADSLMDTANSVAAGTATATAAAAADAVGGSGSRQL